MRWNLGIRKLNDFTFWSGFKFFLPELLVLASVLGHVHNETLAGIFGVPTYKFESFEDGLYRYQTRMMAKNSEQKQQII